MIVEALNKLLEYFQKERHAQTELRAKALDAINLALVETKRYIELTGGKKCSEREREFELSKLWDKASVAVLAVRAADPGFPLELHEKALYWADKQEWSDTEILAKGVSINAVHEQVKSLLVTNS